MKETHMLLSKARPICTEKSGQGDELGMSKAKGQSNYICQEAELRVAKANGQSNLAKRKSSEWPDQWTDNLAKSKTSEWPRLRDRVIRLRGICRSGQGQGQSNW